MTSIPDRTAAGGATVGAIASPHARANDAAMSAYARGGTAIDAALAAAATLSVVYPHNVSIGGDLIALVRDPSGRTVCINASGPAAAGEDLSRLRAAHGDRLPVRGADTVTVPGAVRGWEALHAHGACRPWSELFDDAIEAAREGVPVSRSLAAAFIEEWDDLGADPGFASVFLPEGRPPAHGELFVQPALAATLETIATSGADAFYTGPLAASMTAALQASGSRLMPSDLSGFRVEWCEPLVGEFRGHRIATSPPNSQGFVLLRALARLDDEALADPLGRDFGRLMEIFADANEVRDRLLADPRPVPSVAAAPEGVSGTLPALTDHPVRPRGDTVGIAAVDQDGWAVSLIQSVFHAFGSAVVDPVSGVLFHDRGCGFSLDPSSPNVVAPGKRPAHTLTPVIVEEAGRLRLVSSTMGGPGQPQIHAQVILRALSGLSAADAVAGPRGVVGPQRAGDPPSAVYAEEDLPSEALASLGRTGLPVIMVPPHDEAVGHANAVAVRADGSFDAASDPRSDGLLRAVEFPDKTCRSTRRG